MVDLDAPIIPWEGLGGLKLNCHISDVYSIISETRCEPKVLGKFLIRYEIKNTIDVWFNIVNGRLFKITAAKDYTGKLFGEIGIGMKIAEILKIDPSFTYDEFEEVYCSPKGVYIETDPVKHTALWISVFIKEMDHDSFERGVW